MDPNIFYESAGDAAAVNPNGIRTPLANGWRTFFINYKPVFNNGPIVLPRNSPDCIDLDNWDFNSSISIDK